MNSTNEAHIMYYDAIQGRFVVEVMTVDVRETNDTASSHGEATSNTSVSPDD